MPTKHKSGEIQKKLQASALEACANNGYNPFEELVEIAQHKEKVTVKGVDHMVHTATTDQRITIAKEIASYLSPKIKNAEGSKKDFEFHLHFTKFGGNNTSDPAPSQLRNVTPKITRLQS